jgi:hypothetical protein
MAVFPNLTVEQREKGLTDFNDLALESPLLAKRTLEEAVWQARHPSQELTGEGYVLKVRSANQGN